MSCHGSQNIRSALLGRQTSSASFRNLLSAAPRVGGRQVRCFSSRKATNAHVRKDVEVQRQEDKLAFRTSEEGSEEHLEQRHCSQLQASTNNEVSWCCCEHKSCSSRVYETSTLHCRDKTELTFSRRLPLCRPPRNS